MTDKIKKYQKYRKYLDYKEQYINAKNAASGSTRDSNANVEHKNVTTLTGEQSKDELIGVNRLQMIDMITRLFGEEVANSYIEDLESHLIYKHDETNPNLPYCVSVTMYPFLFEGLKNIGGDSTRPQHLSSFCGSFINLVFAIASQFAGAVSTPEFLTYMDYFLRREYGEDYIYHTDKVVDLSTRGNTIDGVITDYFAQVVYSLNTPSAARNFQSVN